MNIHDINEEPVFHRISDEDLITHANARFGSACTPGRIVSIIMFSVKNAELLTLSAFYSFRATLKIKEYFAN